MNKVDMYVFSGTGNTLFAAKCLKNAFSKHSVECRLLQINSRTDSASIDLSRTLGIGFPIACFSTYPLVHDFINSLPETACQTEVFMFATMGGSDGQVCAQFAPVLQAKGYKLIGYEAFIMPNNFMVNKINTDKNDRLSEICRRRVDDFVSDMLGRSTEFKNGGRLMSKLYKLIYKLCFSSGFITKSFKVKIDSQKCSGCGICVDACPVGNISIIDGKAKLADKCQDCMRCIGFCPEGALKVHKALPYSACSYDEFFSSFDE